MKYWGDSSSRGWRLRLWGGGAILPVVRKRFHPILFAGFPLLLGFESCSPKNGFLFLFCPFFGNPQSGVFYFIFLPPDWPAAPL